jgi:hypothetical protein
MPIPFTRADLDKQVTEAYRKLQAEIRAAAH